MKRAVISFCLLGTIILNCGPSEVEKVEKLKTKLEHKAIKEHIGQGGAKIRATVESTVPLPENAVVLHYRAGENWISTVMHAGAEAGVYEAEIPHQDKGTSVSYYIELTTLTGSRIFLPEEAEAAEYYTLTFKGRVPRALVGIHIGLMLVAIVLILIAVFFANRVIKKGEPISKCLYLALVGAVFIFLGGFPIGMAMEKLVYGTFWEGWPFGRDLTDTKTEVILAFWILALLPMKNTILRKAQARNWISDRVFAYLVVVGGILTFLLYLIPHKNIQF